MFEARTDDWTFHDFERELKKSMGNDYGNYQDAKMTIIEAYRDGHWPKTVERYLQTNYQAFGNLPAEMNEMGHQLGIGKDSKPKI
jgi:methionyl-tRNA synthetase